MSVAHIILGLLREPSTGYSIKQDFDQVFNNFWAAEQSQIYRTLKSLESRGLVSSREAPSQKGPKRCVYTRTAAGRKALLAWLRSDIEIEDSRIPYLARLFFMYQLDDFQETERLLRGVREHFAARLEVIRGIEAFWREEDPRFPDFDADEDFHGHLVLTYGAARVESLLRWADTALERTRARARRRENNEEENIMNDDKRRES